VVADLPPRVPVFGRAGVQDLRLGERTTS